MRRLEQKRPVGMRIVQVFPLHTAIDRSADHGVQSSWVSIGLAGDDQQHTDRQRIKTDDLRIDYHLDSA